MNDTEILNDVLYDLKFYADRGAPVSPSVMLSTAQWIERVRGDRRKGDGVSLCSAAPPISEESLETIEISLPRAERDDWFTSRIDPYDDRIRALERWMHSCTPKDAKDVTPEVDPKLTGVIELCSYCYYPPESCYCARGRGEAGTVAKATVAQATSAAHTHASAKEVVRRARDEKRASDTLNRAFAAPEPPQGFWRCRHYPCATTNFFTAEQCEWGCHLHEPTWDSNGVSSV